MADRERLEGDPRVAAMEQIKYLQSRLENSGDPNEKQQLAAQIEAIAESAGLK